MIFNRNFTYCFCILVAFTLASCSSMYIQGGGNVPLLKEEGEIQAEASFSTNNLQIAGSYAINDHIAGIAGINLSYGNFTNHYDIYTSKDKDSSVLADLVQYGNYNNRYYEIGAGYYNLFNNPIFKTEIFAGAGFCSANDKDDTHTLEYQEYDSKYTLIFTQINAGITYEHFDLGISCRLAPSFHTLKWDNVNTQYNTHKSGTENFSLFHFEPMLFYRLGNEKVKFSAKAGLSIPIKPLSYHDAMLNIPDNSFGHTTFFMFSIGLNFRLDKISEQDKQL